MSTWDKSDDLALALQAATALYKRKRFDRLACAIGDQAATERVAATATMFVAWFRKLGGGSLTLITVEEIDTGEVVWTPTPGGTAMAVIDSSQRARWTFKAKDDRGFAADYALAARLKDGDPAIATVEYFNVGDPGNTSNGTTDPDTGASTEYDQVLATFAGLFGDATVEVFDPAGDPTVVIDSAPLTTQAGAVAPGGLGEAAIEEIP